MPATSPNDGPVAVTGCSGFTGGHMVRELSIHGYEVRACIRDTSSWRGQDAVVYLEKLPNVTIVDRCDLFTPGSYDDAFVTGAKAARVPQGYEWTETDWSSDEVDPERWNHPANSYAHSKVDTEHLINAAADSSESWDAVTMNPAMICGPILFKAQVGQWIEQLGRIAGGFEPNWPSKYDMYYNIIDVRDLVQAHRLAAESTVDHKSSHGGPRYVMHGTGGHSALRLGTDVSEIIHKYFPSYKLGEPATVTSKGEPIRVASNAVNDSKKAKELLGATLRPHRGDYSWGCGNFARTGCNPVSNTKLTPHPHNHFLSPYRHRATPL